MQTFDSRHRTHDARGNMTGKFFEQPYRTHDGFILGGKSCRTVDSTGAFLVGELERLDLTMHEPLAEVSYGRDIDMREDVTIADEVSSFTLSTYASAGGLGAGNSIGNGKAWIGKTSTQIGGVGVDIAKIPHQLRPWGLELKYDLLELESSARVGRPVDTQKYDAIQLKHQMDIDEQVYYGDTTTGDTGLVNADLVTNVNPLPNGVSGGSTWATKSPAEILSDFNFAITSVWKATAWAVIPSRILLPTDDFGYISTQLVSIAGNTSILKYVLENNLLATSGRGKLEIFPAKWCNGAGAGGTIGDSSTTNRMVVYTKDKKRVRYPMTLLQRTALQYDGMYQKTTYYCRLGVTEVVYPETIGYFDGL